MLKTITYCSNLNVYKEYGYKRAVIYVHSVIYLTIFALINYSKPKNISGNDKKSFTYYHFFNGLHKW